MCQRLHKCVNTSETKGAANLIPRPPTLLFGCTADGERMPLVNSNRRYVNEHVITGMKIKMRWSLDDEMGDARGQQQTRAYVRFSTLRTGH